MRDRANGDKTEVGRPPANRASLSAAPLRSNAVNRVLASGDAPLNAGAVRSLQGTVGNIAVQRLVNPTVQRVLVPSAAHAFAIARENESRSNRDAYQTARALTDAHMPASHQKELTKIRAGRDTELADLVRAFVLKAYAHVLNDKITAGSFTADKIPTRYLKRSRLLRDMYSGLITKGRASPEAQAFLAKEGFALSAPRRQREAEEARWPRIEVLSSWAGARVFGRRHRAHLLILFTTSNGRQIAVHAGPDNGGRIEATWVAYEKAKDFDPSAPSVPVDMKDQGDELLDKLIAAGERINARDLPYVESTRLYTGGQNCNSAVFTMLKAAGLETRKPGGQHPGWQNDLFTVVKSEKDQNEEEDEEEEEGEEVKGTKADIGADTDAFTNRGLVGATVRQLKKGTPVKVLAEGKAVGTGVEYSMVRLKNDQIVYVDKSTIQPRGAAAVGGLFAQIDLGNRQMPMTVAGTTASVTTGNRVQIVDLNFAFGGTWDDQMVNIKLADGKQGLVFGRFLRPEPAPQQGSSSGGSSGGSGGGGSKWLAGTTVGGRNAKFQAFSRPPRQRTESISDEESESTSDIESEPESTTITTTTTTTTTTGGGDELFGITYNYDDDDDQDY